MIQVAYLPLTIEELDNLEDLYTLPRSTWTIGDVNKDICTEYNIKFQDGAIVCMRIISTNKDHPYLECMLIKDNVVRGYQTCSPHDPPPYGCESIWNRWIFNARDDQYIFNIVIKADILDLHLEIQPDDTVRDILLNIQSQNSKYIESDGGLLYARTEEAMEEMCDWLDQFYGEEYIDVQEIDDEAWKYGRWVINILA
jgi:hypothetical protein